MKLWRLNIDTVRHGIRSEWYTTKSLAQARARNFNSQEPWSDQVVSLVPINVPVFKDSLCAFLNQLENKNEPDPTATE